MKIPFTLTMTSNRKPATALLVPGSRAADVFDLILRLRLETPPAVFATSDGFLIKLPSPRETPLGGVVRLRSLADNLLLPVDADLTPPLLQDEARGLTRSRGLVFLPGSRILAFDAERPLDWKSLLHPPRLRAPAWWSLPDAPALADELVEVTSIAPRPLPTAIVEQGGGDIGTQSPRPANAANVGTQILGTSLFVVGHMMAWLGTQLGLGGIAGKGAEMLQRALDRVPRLSEFLMNQQEALLRNLLKDFREGRIEEALRRAMPLGGQTGAATPTTSGLPTHNLMYSLQNLLGGRNLPGSAWFTPDDLYFSLQSEYRKQAEAAAKEGDYRRAAFIYAKLLNDLSGAARILSQGGLHADAAVIYEDALNNPRSAAQEWEAAGEIEKALEILATRLSDHRAAGDLLRKVGENERAVKYYLAAAQELRRFDKYFEAGEIMRTCAHRPDLALAFYAEGWATRPQAHAVPCGLFLATRHSTESDVVRFRQVVDDAYECLSDWSDASSVQFFNQIARLANMSQLAGVADTTRDRCLMALASKMADATSAAGRQGDIYFPADTPWSAPVVRDALFAARRALPSTMPRKPRTLVRLGRSTVRAVCQMPTSGDLFLGFDDGEILHYRPTTGETRTLARHAGAIQGLHFDAEEHHLTVLSLRKTPVAGHTVAQLLIGSRSDKFDVREFAQIPRVSSPTRLLSAVDDHIFPIVGAIAGEEVHLFGCDNPSWRRSYIPKLGEPPIAGIVGRTNGIPWELFVFETEVRFFLNLEEPVTIESEFPPQQPDRTTIYQPPLIGWMENQETTKVRWLTGDGQSVEMTIEHRTPIEISMPRLWPTAKPSPGIRGSVDRSRVGLGSSSLWDRLDDRSLGENPVAALRQQSGEILVVDANGTLSLVAESRPR